MLHPPSQWRTTRKIGRKISLVRSSSSYSLSKACSNFPSNLDQHTNAFESSSVANMRQTKGCLQPTSIAKTKLSIKKARFPIVAQDSCLICKGPILSPPSPVGAGIIKLVSTWRRPFSNVLYLSLYSSMSGRQDKGKCILRAVVEDW